MLLKLKSLKIIIDKFNFYSKATFTEWAKRFHCVPPIPPNFPK